MSFFMSREERALKTAIKANASPITLLKCMQDVMETDSERQGENPLFTDALYKFCTKENSGIIRISGLAELVLNYNADNHYSRSILAALRGQALEFHHACSGPFQQREQIGFRLFYDLYQCSKSVLARDAFAQMACNTINAFEKGEVVSVAMELARKGHSAAYDYMVKHHLKLTEKFPVTQAVHYIRSRIDSASPDLDPTAPYAAVATILSTTSVESFHPEQLIDTALWSLERPAEKVGGKHDAQAHMAVMLSDTWLPDHANQHGIAKTAPYAEKLYELAPDQHIKKTVSAFMAPRLDLLAATPEQFGPAVTWAMRIGANTPEVIAFTEHNLARLFQTHADRASFKTLISYAAPDVLNRFAEALPTAERDAFSLLRPRQGAFKITV